MKNMFTTFLYYISLWFALFIVLAIYSDDLGFPWSTNAESLKYLHFLITVPGPLIIALFSTFEFLEEHENLKSIKCIRRMFLLLTFCCSTVYMLVDGGKIGHTKIVVGFVIALVIAGLSLLLPFIEILLYRRQQHKIDPKM